MFEGLKFRRCSLLLRGCGALHCIILACCVLLLFGMGGFGGLVSKANAAAVKVTYSRDVAPIVYQRCATCHHKGGAGPFSLMTFEETRRQWRVIEDVVKRRLMPPWLPEPGHGDFVGNRRLTDAEMKTIQQWVDDGLQEGDKSDLPAKPVFKDDWKLGEPDLVVRMQVPYTLPADGKDVYRNFVIPIPTRELKHVRGMELKMEDNSVLHHAFMMIDESGTSRQLDIKDAGPGFDGMEIQSRAHSPSGHFVSWQPGELPKLAPADMSWPLRTGTDLVLQMHLRPSGKPERVMASVGIYFSKQASRRHVLKLSLRDQRISIPDEVANYVVKDQFELPVDVQVRAVLPHAHYLGRRLEGYAILPSGQKKPLLLIKAWDFNWQSAYEYKRPVFLPKGTVLHMHYTFDNSSDNLSNPNFPPKPVRYGLMSNDEMAEFWLQVETETASELAALHKAFVAKGLSRLLEYNQWLAAEDPKNADARAEIGRILMGMGRTNDALEYLQKTMRSYADSPAVNLRLGVLYFNTRNISRSLPLLKNAAAGDPENFEAHFYLTQVYMRVQDVAGVRKHLPLVARYAPDEPKVRFQVGVLSMQANDPRAAVEQFNKALQMNPDAALTDQIRKRLDLAKQKSR